MLTVQIPWVSFRKGSIFRRFLKGEREEALSSTLLSKPIGGDFRPIPRKLSRHRPEPPTYLATPAAPPEQHAVVKAKATKRRRLQMITHIQHVGIPSKQQTDDPARHHAATNLPGRVLPSAMPTKPFPGTPLIQPWEVFLPPSQIFSLYLGFLPKDTSDKWFVYSEGPDQTGKFKVHFHRSGTGTKVAELFVVIDIKGEGAGKVVGVKWNGSAEMNWMNEEEAKYMIRTSCKWALGVDLEQGS